MSCETAVTLSLLHDGVRKCFKTTDLINHISDTLLVHWQHSELHFLASDPDGFMFIHACDLISTYLFKPLTIFPNVFSKVNGVHLADELKVIDRSKRVGCLMFTPHQENKSATLTLYSIDAKSNYENKAAIEVNYQKIDSLAIRPRVYYPLFTMDQNRQDIGEDDLVQQQAIVSFSFHIQEWTRYINELAIAAGSHSGPMTLTVSMQSDHDCHIIWELNSILHIRIQVETSLTSKIVPVKWYQPEIREVTLHLLLNGFKRLMISNTIHHLGQTWFHVLPHGLLIELVSAGDTDAPIFPLRCYLKDVSKNDLSSYC